ncbi:MAG: phosphatase PAP2 family protein [Deltaproteobacteria bacterium]|nr:phosphatase PAP2 family protein [Deltaproteobacteria bacterium]
MNSAENSRRTGFLVLAGVAAFLLAATLAARALALDLAVSGWFYDPVSGFFLRRAQPWEFMYRYGYLPGLVLTIVAVLAWAASFRLARLAAWRPYIALFALTSIIGAGVLVNGVLKPWWGRPRPVEVEQFGGHWQYQPPLSPGKMGKGHSFACGHATMGFVFFAVVFWWRKSRKAALAGVAATVMLGGLLSAARLVQGAHFFTDCLWSAGLMFLTAGSLYWWVLRIPQGGGLPKIGTTGKTALALAGLLAGGLLLVQPVYEDLRVYVERAEKPGRLKVRINHPLVREVVRYQEGRPQVSVVVEGFALPGNDVLAYIRAPLTGDALVCDYELLFRGVFLKRQARARAYLPPQWEGKVGVDFIIAGEKVE